jgi:hypothetical protein
VVPTSWHGEACLRVCVVHPRTDVQRVISILDDLAAQRPLEGTVDEPRVSTTSIGEIGLHP